MILVLEYPKCSTCKKALNWLKENNIAFEDRHIVEQNPKELGLKDKLPAMSEQEQLELLATNGMLVKRPLVVGENFVLTGFKEAEWEQLKG